jgi:hydroxypyruvate isomerase
MPKFSANLSFLFKELDFLSRFSAASEAGFSAIEFMSPYEFDAKTLLAGLKEAGLDLILHNVPSGNWEAGDRGIACHPDRVEEFREGVQRAIEYAQILNVPNINCLAGIQPGNVSDEQARRTLVENLRFAARRFSSEGIRLLVEPINNVDIPGFFVNSTKSFLELSKEVHEENLFLQYDVYHAQKMEGDLSRTIKANLNRIAHIQIADNPGRHEPGTGEISYEFLLRYLDDIGYNGYVGCEYTIYGRHRFHRTRNHGNTYGNKFTEGRSSSFSAQP